MKKTIEDLNHNLVCYVYNKDMVELIYNVELFKQSRSFGRFADDFCDEVDNGLQEGINLNEDSKLGGKTLVFNFDIDTIFDLDHETGIYNKKYCEVDSINDVTIKVKLKNGLVTWGEIYKIVSGMIYKNGHLFWEMSFFESENNEVEVYLRD